MLVITGPLAALAGAVQPKISIATIAANVTTSRRFITFRTISSQDIIRLVVCPDRLGSVAGVLYQKSCWIHGGIMRCGKEVSRLVRGAKKGRGGYTGQDLSNWPGPDKKRWRVNEMSLPSSPNDDILLNLRGKSPEPLCPCGSLARPVE